MKIVTASTNAEDSGLTTTLHQTMAEAYENLRTGFTPELSEDSSIEAIAAALDWLPQFAYDVTEHDFTVPHEDVVEWLQRAPAGVRPVLTRTDDLNADHLHVILDALQFVAQQNIPEHFSASYDDPHPEDPKGTPEGWERTRAEAEKIVGDLLSQS